MMLSRARLASANASMVDHYDPVNRTILLTKLKGKLKNNAPTEKRVPVCDELAEMLDRLIKARNLKPGDPFFGTNTNNRAFASAAKAAGLAGCTITLAGIGSGRQPFTKLETRLRPLICFATMTAG
jgi:integrase